MPGQALVTTAMRSSSSIFPCDHSPYACSTVRRHGLDLADFVLDLSSILLLTTCFHRELGGDLRFELVSMPCVLWER